MSASAALAGGYSLVVLPTDDLEHASPVTRPARANRARWLVRLRWVGLGVAAVILAATALLAPEALGAGKAAGLLAVFGALAAANAVLDARLRVGATPERALFLATVGDTLAITVALHMTGGVENPFQVYYLFPVIVAGIALPRSRSYAIALLASALFVALGILEYTKLLPHHDVSLLPIWRPIATQAFDQFEDFHYVTGASVVLISTLAAACYLTTSVADQLRSSEHDLALAKDRLEGVLRGLGEGVAYFDAGERLVLANDAFSRLLPAREGTHVLEIAEGELREPLARALAQVKGGVPFESFEARDRSRVLACGLSAVRGSGGIAWVVEDVTERRLAVERAELERRLLDLGVLAAGIAHEVLNPLAAISSTAELIETDPGEPVRDRVGRIKKQVDRITRTVRSVAELARPTSGRPTPVALDEVVADAVARAREERAGAGDIAIEVEKPSPLALVSAEPLRVAVKNLVTNALDAAGSAGHVRVRARRDGDEAVIEVEDDGPGIADPSRIFVPFFTTKEPGNGAGLGLPIAGSIVRQHGGKIEVHSAPGRGARFTMRLPGRVR
jgi:two-component system sensor histidine kinase PilS (NtrC family)